MLIFSLLTAALCLTQDPAGELPGSPADVPTPPLAEIAPIEPTRITLDGGIELMLVEDATLPLVDGVIMIAAGDLRDPMGKSGLATLWTEALRKGGCEAFTGIEFDQWLSARAVELSFASTPDQLRITFNCLSADLEGVLERIGQLLAAPAFEAQAVEVARAQLQTSVARRQDDSAALADVTLDMLLFGEGSPWGSAPSLASVAAITPADLAAQSARFLGEDRLHVGLSGAFDPQAAQAAVAAAFAPLPALGAAPPLPEKSFNIPSQTTIYLIDKPGVPQTELRIAAPGYQLTDPLQARMTLWSYVMGTGGMTNRLMSRIRTELGLAYGVGASFVPSLTTSGRLYAYCATRNDAVGQALGELIELLLESGAEPFPKDELEAARARLLTSHVFQTDTSREVLERAMVLDFNDMPADAWATNLERLRTATAKQVQAAARGSIPAGRLLCLAVGPADEIERQLEGVARVIRIGKPQDLADASAEIERMLTALGGREAWAALEGLRIRQDVVIKSDRGDITVEVEQWRRFNPRSIRLRQTSKLGAIYTNVITPTEGWVRAPTGISRVDTTMVQSWQAVLSRWLYYNLHLLATGSDTIESGLDPEGRIVLLDSLGEIGRITLDAQGLPARYELLESGEEKTYIYSNWQAYDGYQIASRYIDGVQHVELLEIEPNPEMDDNTFKVQ